MAHVLIVDDDADTREALRLAMEDPGHTVKEAAGGSIAIEALRGASGGVVVLLDYVMPAMTGLDVLNVAVGDAALARCHAYILLTASPQQGQTRLAAVDGHLHVTLVAKPFNLDALLEAVDVAARLTQPAV